MQGCMEPYRPILIAGPTASGKSALALRLAARHGGVVINADSMQVYSDLTILTARPSGEECADVPHALFGHVPGTEAYSVGRWLADVAAVLDDCRRRGRVPIITGGTGLYFKALLEGLSPIPPVPDEVREHWRAEAALIGAAELHRMLAERDPQTAAVLRPSDTQRLTRALEVHAATGRGLSAWQREPGKPLVDPAAVLRLVISHDRDVLHARADTRFDRMMAQGALDEVRALSARGYATDLPVMRALGVAPLIEVLAGRKALDAAVEQAKRDTRQYIRRQLTWQRRNMIAWKIVDTQEVEIIAG